MKTWLIGVDEVGRGPLAGPVAVGAVLVPVSFDWSQLSGVRDSKQMSEKQREAIFKAARKLQRDGQLQYAVSLVSASTIDQRGIVHAISLAMERALRSLERRQTSNVNITSLAAGASVKLDGGLRAPAQYESQETIIKGDSKERVIGLASIVAKVTRDRYMTRQAKLAAYAPYSFSVHKGYGTKAHRAAIGKYGLSKLHRTTFCKNVKDVR